MSQAGVIRASGSSNAITQIDGNTGSALPVGGVVNIVGDGQIIGTSGSGDTLTITSVAGTILWDNQTASGDTSVVFNDLSASYNNYNLYCIGVTNPTSGGTNTLIIQLSTDGGSSWITTDYYAAGSNITGLNIATSIASTEINNVMCFLFNLTSGSSYISCSGRGCQFNTVGPFNSTMSQDSSYSVANTAVNKIRVVINDGSAFSGNFQLYAVNM